VVGSEGSCVLKLDPHEIEQKFYTRFAVEVSESGLGVPRLLGHSQDDYLLLERVDTDLEPNIEPQTLVEELHRLHTTVAVPRDDVLFQPQWPSDLTCQALERLNVSDRAIWRRAGECRNTALDAWAPECVISGDPNPSNWGRRERGQLVLFDWERFGVGQPELDVAIVMRGLPSRGEIEAVAGPYSALSGRGSPEETYQKLVAWKLWTVLEFVTEPQSPARERTTQWLALNFGQWIGSV
jgi:aminoglycoside phosphotransferase (APT) family kinase protein